MSCDPERVTGFVDGELDAETTAAVAAHLETCAACRTQAEAERGLHARLRSLPAPELPAGIEARVRAQARRRSWAPAAVARWALPLAAVLVAAFWARGHAPLVAWELVRDHDHCFSFRPLPAKVWSGEPGVVGAWFERQGTRLPPVPDRVGELALVGARYCPLPDVSLAPHVYYASATSQVSVFLVPHGVRLDERFAGEVRGRAVRLLRVEGETVGIVAESDADARAFEAALRPVLAAWVRE
ncbi:MAG TPA: zf-HC2 domain-containing protein [Thermoleophilaceae bacterium]|nr:zf-HC2 domain-containing protein [Thermoleophilaceae bacterium]